MSEISRFSLVYDPEEDRIAWDMEDVAGGGARLWLTQRFCRALLTALFPMIAPPAAAGDAPALADTLQSWEQAAAMADFGKTPSVRHQSGATSGLVRTVHMTPAGESMTFTFEFGLGEQRIVGVGKAELRQTLQVLHRLHVAAAWPLDLWPAWIETAEAPPEAGPVRH